EAFHFPEEEAQIGIEALIHACARCGMGGAGRIYEIVTLRAAENRYSPVGEWICSTPWDGRSRIRDLCDTIIMRVPAHNRWRDVVLRRWLLQTVAAIRNWEDEPTVIGHVLVLQGEQDKNKSSWLEALLPKPWVTIGMSLRLDSFSERDVVARATRTPITDLGELDHSFNRADAP